MIIGFTGTQRGLTKYQTEALVKMLVAWIAVDNAKEFHHGDCVGADDQAGRIACKLGLIVITHPPIDKRKRAFSPADGILPVKSYRERNSDIVAAADVMIACPGEMQEIIRSGTWMTIRMTRYSQKRLIVIPPKHA